ncbi:insulinase family metalloase domain protein [Chlamydia psittaci 06-1683]|nr:insulinase family metalloase domain protein [Chlamydia psittaci 06-1683]
MAFPRKTQCSVKCASPGKSYGSGEFPVFTAKAAPELEIPGWEMMSNCSPLGQMIFAVL